MGTLIDLKNKIDAIRTDLGTIKGFIFDDKSAINDNSQDEYPLLLTRIPDSEWDSSLMESRECPIEMFLTDTELSDSVDHWTVKASELEVLMRSVVKGFEGDNNYRIITKPKFISYHHEGNNKLVCVKASFILKIYYGC